MFLLASCEVISVGKSCQLAVPGSGSSGELPCNFGSSGELPTLAVPGSCAVPGIANFGSSGD